MNTPSLSVIIPNYNDGHLLERCLTAVMTQERLPDEIVIYDDCSTDDSLDTIQELCRRWPLVQLKQGNKNLGVIGAMNRMLPEVKGEWVHFLAADDCPLPGYYKLAMEKAGAHPEAAVLFGAYVGVDDKTGGRYTETADNWIEPGYISPERIVSELLDKAPARFGLGYAVIWRTWALCSQEGFDSELRSFTDNAAFRFLGARHGGVYLSGSPLACVRVSADTYGGKDSEDKLKYVELFELVAQKMRTQYSDLFSERFVQNWLDKAYCELELKPWPKWRRAKHAVPWLFHKAWRISLRMLGR